MTQMRGLFRYETVPGHWWACAYDLDNGVRVHIERSRYENMRIEPPFDELPVEHDDAKKNGKRKA